MCQFAETHAALLADGSVGKGMCDEVAAAVSEIEARSTAQGSSKRAGMEGTALKSVAKDRLLRMLVAMRDTAREMARTSPGLEEKFRIPRSGGDQAWLSLARSFARDAAPLKDGFERWGMPQNFLDELNAEIADYERSINSRAQKQGERGDATAAIDAALERGVAAARALDAVVRNTFRDDRAALAEWTSAGHVERQARADAAQATRPNTNRHSLRVERQGLYVRGPAAERIDGDSPGRRASYFLHRAYRAPVRPRNYFG